MKYTDQWFKFPVKVYTARDWKKIEKIEKKEEDTDTDLSDEMFEPDFAEGFNYVFHEDIVGIGPMFSFPRSIADVRENGFDLTKVLLKNGDTLYSAWSPDLFTEELDNHVLGLQDAYKEERDKNIEEQAIAIRTALEKHLTDVKQKYKDSGMKLDTSELEDSINLD